MTLVLDSYSARQWKMASLVPSCLQAVPSLFSRLQVVRLHQWGFKWWFHLNRHRLVPQLLLLAPQLPGPILPLVGCLPISRQWIQWLRLHLMLLIPRYLHLDFRSGLHLLEYRLQLHHYHLHCRFLQLHPLQVHFRLHLFLEWQQQRRFLITHRLMHLNLSCQEWGHFHRHFLRHHLNLQSPLSHWLWQCKGRLVLCLLHRPRQNLLMNSSQLLSHLVKSQRPRYHRQLSHSRPQALQLVVLLH